MYEDVEITPEIEAEYIEKAAQKIHEYQMETAAILILESTKPLVWIGGEFGRFFISPFVPAVSEKWGVISEKFLQVFEKRENVEKLLKRMEQLVQEDEDKKKAEKEAAKQKKLEDAKNKEANSTSSSGAVESENEKKGWRKYIPF